MAKLVKATEYPVRNCEIAGSGELRYNVTLKSMQLVETTELGDGTNPAQEEFFGTIWLEGIDDQGNVIPGSKQNLWDYKEGENHVMEKSTTPVEMATTKLVTFDNPNTKKAKIRITFDVREDDDDAGLFQGDDYLKCEPIEILLDQVGLFSGKGNGTENFKIVHARDGTTDLAFYFFITDLR